MAIAKMYKHWIDFGRTARVVTGFGEMNNEKGRRTLRAQCTCMGKCISIDVVISVFGAL